MLSKVFLDYTSYTKTSRITKDLASAHKLFAGALLFQTS